MQPLVYFPDNDRAELITTELINKLGTVPMARDTIDACSRIAVIREIDPISER